MCKGYMIWGDENGPLATHDTVATVNKENILQAYTYRCQWVKGDATE